MVQINPQENPLFSIFLCNSMDREEESSTTFRRQLQPRVSYGDSNKFGEPARSLEADCKPGRISCCRTKGSLAACCLSWCCDSSKIIDLTFFNDFKRWQTDIQWSDWSPPQKEEKATTNQHQTVTNSTHTFTFSSFLFTLPASRVLFNQYAKMHHQKPLSYCVGMSACGSKMNTVVSSMIPEYICMQR